MMEFGAYKIHDDDVVVMTIKIMLMKWVYAK